MLKLIWFTDLHLRPMDDPDGLAAAERLRTCLDHAWEHHADADLCVISGDIANQGASREYEHFAAMDFDRWEALQILPGNHDNPPRLARAAGRQDRSWPECMDLGGHKLVFLDTSLPGQDRGQVGPSVLARIGALCAQGSVPILLFMHHQPIPTFVPSADTIGLADEAALGALVAKHRDRIRHIFFGHCHLPISGSLHGVGVTGLPATAPQQSPNFADTRFVPDLDAPPAYGVILARDDTIVVHIVTPR